MRNVSTRLYLVAAIVVISYGIGFLLQAAAQPPEIELPDWSLQELPYQLGTWHGEDTEMDPKIAAATGAKVITNRLYRNEAGHMVSLHSAMFEDPAEGTYHSPLNCYRSSGWKKLTETKEDVKIADDLTITVCMTSWEKEGEKVIVVYWYQLGEHLLYGRWDLGTVRWSMRGMEKWPILVKAMVAGSHGRL